MIKEPVRALNLLRRFPYTSLALVLALLVTAAGLVWHIDVFEVPGSGLIGIEHSEAGEIAIAFLMLIPASFVDRVLARQRALEAQLQAEQLRVLRVTMRTVQDIVNNNLNQFQLLRLEAQGHVSDATLTLFDQALEDTALQLRALGNMEVFVERPMATGSGLAVDVPRPTRPPP